MPHPWRRIAAGIGGLGTTLRTGTRNRLDTAAGPIARATLTFAHELRLAWAARGGALRVRRIARQSEGLRVQLGSGTDVRSGWVNIDLSLDRIRVPSPPNSNSRSTMYVNHDLRRGLPLPRGSCELIYSSHFFEHLDRRDGLRVMRDAYRALRPAGIFRIVIPDFRGCFDAYVRNDAEYFSLIQLEEVFPKQEARPLTLIDQLNYAVYQFGEHRCLYDEEKLRALLTTIGFRNVHRTDYDRTLDAPSAIRTRYSLYMQATK